MPERQNRISKTFESQRAQRRGAFTRLELVVVIAVIAFVVYCMAYASAHPRPLPKRSPNLGCVSNLKMIGVGFAVYANDNSGKYPRLTNLVGNGYVWANFAAVNNEVSMLRELVCPADQARLTNTIRSGTVDFSNGPNGFSRPANQENALSYFYGLSASETDPNTVLSGDRNLTANQPDGPDVSPKWSYAGKGPTGGNPGISLGGRSTPPTCGWNSALHHFNGNILLGDGSVQQMTTPSLVELLAKNEDTNNCFLFPINAPGEK
jgi:competence protein ComGC